MPSMPSEPVTLSNHLNAEVEAQCPYFASKDQDVAGPTYLPKPNSTLSDVDPEMAALVDEEKTRQIECIELIASENFTSKAVMETLGSCLTNKYSEGQAGARYYGGNEVIDKIENLCKSRALKAFGLKESEWGVNVQPYSGSPANFAVYTGLLKPHDRVMGLDLPSGGHLTHGYYTASGKKISATSIYFESLPYQVKPDTGLIDFDNLLQQAKLFRPQMILCGASAYPRVMEWHKFRQIADEVGALLMADMAHISGLVATGVHPSPFEHCHIVTTTTHKSLRGPRSGMIFYPLTLEKEYKESLAVPKGSSPVPAKKFPAALINNVFKENSSIKEKIDMAVFPALQGGPHNHQIGALAVQLKEVATEDFVNYSKAVVRNSKALASALMKPENGSCKLVTNGTDNHLLLVDCVTSFGVNGKKFEKVCDLAGITLNKNTIPGDTNALVPSGVRIGTCAMTTRGCTEESMEVIAKFLGVAGVIARECQDVKGKKAVDFEAGLVVGEGSGFGERIVELKKEVGAWARGFEYPGM